MEITIEQLIAVIGKQTVEIDILRQQIAELQAKLKEAKND